MFRDPAALLVEAPEADLEIFKLREVGKGRTDGFGWHDEDGLVREIPVAECLLETLFPILELGFEGDELAATQALVQGERRKILSDAVRIPRDPDQIGSAEVLQSELGGCDTLLPVALSVGAFEGAEKVGLTPLASDTIRKVFSAVETIELQSMSFFHGNVHLLKLGASQCRCQKGKLRMFH